MKSVMQTKRFSEREIILLLGGMTALAFLLLIFRIRIEENFRYTFLVWNLFLAYVPIGLILIYNGLPKNRGVRGVMLGSWLLFFPNAPYILTDYIHLRHYFTLLDFAIVSFYALLGLLAGFYSLRIIQRDISLLNHFWSTFFLFFLTSIGVYLGRFIRWNSWDFVNHPIRIFRDIAALFFHPVQNAWALVFIGVFTLFLGGTYILFKKLMGWIHEEKEV